ncbi:hypothetical protein ACQZ4Z_26835, partial [Agrobacterium vitis]
MCGRPPFGKDYFGVLTGWSVAGMCPAFDCGLSRLPLAMMKSADQVPNKPPRFSRSSQSGLSRSGFRPLSSHHQHLTNSFGLKKLSMRFVSSSLGNVNLALRSHDLGLRFWFRRLECQRFGTMFAWL